MKNAIEIKGLVKDYGSSFHLGPIDLKIKSGIIVGLVGENGAGKTTIIKSILNIIKSDGDINIFGRDIKESENEIKEDIGVVLDDMFFPENIYVSDLDNIMKDVFKRWNSQEFMQYLNEFKIDLNKQIKNLSKGTRKKLEIAVALSHDAKLLILDEPTSGLDPVVRNEILDIFLRFIKDDEHTILLSTHITSDLEYISDEIVLINDGKILLLDSRDNICENYGVIKCSKDALEKLDDEYIIAKVHNKYNYEVLVTDKDKFKKKHKDLVIDKVTIEKLMLMMIKGEK